MFAILQYTEINQTKPLNVTLYYDGAPQVMDQSLNCDL